MGLSIKFGDVFIHRGIEYVYLAGTEEIIYAGRILEKDRRTEELKCLCDKRSTQGGLYAQRAQDNLLFCYVELCTKEFEGRLAHFKDTPRGETTEGLLFDTILGSLNKEDLLKIKEEIIRGPLPGLLKNLVRDIKI